MTAPASSLRSKPWGAQPLIPFKKNSTGAVPYTGRHAEVWQRAFHLFSYRRQAFVGKAKTTVAY